MPAPPLSPFLGDVDQPLDDALRALVAPGDLAMRWRLDGERLEITVRGGGDRTLRMALAPADGGAWSAAGHALTCRRSGDPLRDPALRPLLARLSAAFGGGDGPELLAEVAAQRLRRSGLGKLNDDFYRSIEQTTEGVAGILRLGFRCNQDCGFCWQSRRWPGPPEALYSTWIDEIAAAGCRLLTISGGEPTLSAALPALIRRATRDHGMRVNLQTNAIRMRRPRYTAALVDAGLDSVLVSLHSADAAISDRMTRAPGTWARTIEGTEALLRAGVSVGLNCVVDADNCDGLAAHAALVVERLVTPFPENPVRVVNYSQPGDYWDAALCREKLPPLDRVRPQLVAAAQILAAAGVEREILGTCGFPGCALRDAPELGLWRRRDGMEERHLGGRTLSPGVCGGCAARGVCPGPRKIYLEVWGERGLEAFEVAPG